MKLRTGYLISAAVTGFLFLLSLIRTLPDGKMHIYYCDVGQGDSAYIRFPDGRDMLVDGGPDDSVLLCLSRHMPFWDRHINIIALSHPQKDHLQGLLSVVKRYSADYFLRSDALNASEGFNDLARELSDARIPVRLLIRGDRLTVGATSVSFLWPSEEQIALGKPAEPTDDPVSGGSKILGTSTGDLNDYSLVFMLQYSTFDAVFPGDADSHIQGRFVDENYPFSATEIANRTIEVLKVPHHGSATGMTKEFLARLRPIVAIISVGKNSFGHPSPETLTSLQGVGSDLYRTDKSGDIEVVTDGHQWSVHGSKQVRE